MIVRTLVSRFGHSVSKHRKSCRPTRQRAARAIASASNEHRTNQAYFRRNGSGSRPSWMTYRYIFRTASLFAQKLCGTSTSSRTHTSAGSFAFTALSSVAQPSLLAV